MKQRIWFDRTFELGVPTDALPELLERLRGTPARLEERVDRAGASRWTDRVDGRWSIQENVGHLLDLEPLWAGRLEDLRAGRETLRPADLRNTATHEADHNERPMSALLADFREARMSFVEQLSSLTGTDLARSALHPRLRQPMTALDLMFFVAEHDDHHLARIGALS